MGKKFALKGYFKVRDNSLFYYPSVQERKIFPHKLEVQGKWRLDKDNTLLFIVDESQSRRFGTTVTFSARVNKARSRSLEFSLLRRLTPSLRKIKRIKLKGFWKADKYAKLSFLVKRGKKSDQLIFTGDWYLDKTNRVIYSYKRRFVKKRIINSFVLKGKWGLKANVLNFTLERSDKPLFSYCISPARRILNLQRQKISFTLGGDYLARKTKRKKTKVISLWGKWRVNKTTVEFRIENGGTLKFKLNKQLGKGKAVDFQLIDRKGKPLGFKVTVSKKLFKDGCFYLEGKYGREIMVKAGVFLPI